MVIDRHQVLGMLLRIGWISEETAMYGEMGMCFWLGLICLSDL